MTYHRIPINDLIDHEESATCQCEPEIEFLENGDMIIKHNAMDGRSDKEKLNETVKG